MAIPPGVTNMADALAAIVGSPAPATETAAPTTSELPTAPATTPSTVTAPAPAPAPETGEKTTGPVETATTTEPTTPAQELELLDLPKAPDVTTELEDLLNVDAPAPEKAPTQETKPADTETDSEADDIDVNAIQPDRTYTVKGGRFRRIYNAHKAASEVAATHGIDIRTPEGVARIQELAGVERGFAQFMSDIASPTEVQHFSKFVLEQDSNGTVAKNVINSLINTAPELKAEFEHEIGQSAVLQTLGEVFKSATGTDPASANLRASVQWLAKQLGIEMSEIEKVTPKPKLTPEQLENIRLKRELEARDNEALKSIASTIHAQAKRQVGQTAEDAVNGFVRTLLPKLFADNVPAHLTTLRGDVTMKLHQVVTEALKSDPDFTSAVRAAKADIDSGKAKDPGQIVRIYREKLNTVLSPSNKLSKAYKTVLAETQAMRSKMTGTVTTRVDAAAKAQAQPVTTSAGTPAVRPDFKLRPGETKEQARARILGDLTKMTN